MVSTRFFFEHSLYVPTHARPYKSVSSTSMQMAQGHLLSTQRALGCHDILATIFSDVATLKNGWDAPFRKGDLVKLALVCRGWRVHTLRLVWRDLDSLLPLWRLLAPSSLPTPTGGAQTDEYCDAVSGHTQPSECDNELN